MYIGILGGDYDRYPGGLPGDISFPVTDLVNLIFIIRYRADRSWTTFVWWSHFEAAAFPSNKTKVDNHKL